jgi:hypothetical protein
MVRIGVGSAVVFADGRVIYTYDPGYGGYNNYFASDILQGW